MASRLCVGVERWASLIRAVTAVWVGGVAVAGCAPRREEPKASKPQPVKVVTARLEPFKVEARTIGKTRATEQVVIRARVRGFLTKINFKEGDNVKARDLLFVIDETPFQARVASAQAKYDGALASLSKANLSQRREIAKAQLDLDEAQLALSNVEQRRVRTLLSRNAASQQDVDQVDANQKKSAAQVEADKANYDQAKADYKVDIESARASVEDATAALADAQLNLGYCRMYAPIDGRIGEAKVKVGNLVGSETGADSTELATIQKIDPMGIDIQVSSKYLERATYLIKRGLHARFTRPGPEGDVLFPAPATIYFIDNAVDLSTGEFLAKATVPNQEGTLLPGDSVNLTVVVEELSKALVVPEPAVVETQGGNEQIYVVSNDGEVEIRPVQAGPTRNGLRLIRTGVKAGDVVIVEGFQLVRPGDRVETEPWTPPPSDPDHVDESSPKPVEAAGSALKAGPDAVKPAAADHEDAPKP